MKKKKLTEKLFHTVFLLCGLVAVAFVLGISIYLIVSGIPAIRQVGIIDFLFGDTWSSGTEQFGILPFILTSVYGTAGAIVLGVPLGLLTAIFIAKIAPPRIASVISSAVGLLAGIPSVVYGLVGMTVLVPGIQSAFGLSSGACLLAAILVLAVMILPYIVSVSETALRAVPPEYEEASLALGATRMETYFKVSLRAARSGVITSVVQGVGRAIGEAMAIIMVSGNVPNMPQLFGSVRFLTTAIVSEMSYAPYGLAPAAGAVLDRTCSVPVYNVDKRTAAYGRFKGGVLSRARATYMKRKLKNGASAALVGIAGAVTVLLLLFLIGYILLRGLPELSLEMLTSERSYITDTVGILPNILSTLYIIIVSMVIVLPLGVGAAIYLSEYARAGRLVKLITFAVDTLTGIPSIIFGLVGMLFFGQILGLKQGILAGGLTLVIMVLPTVIGNTLESLHSVPNSFREGALALGSGKWHMIRTVVLPNALDGILTGCILSVGRITGESAALLFTAGFGLKLTDFFTSLTSSSATLSVALYVYAGEEGRFDIAFAIAAVLIVIVLLLNLAAALTAKLLKGKRK